MRRWLEERGARSEERELLFPLLLLLAFITLSLSSCGGGRQASTHDEGDTVRLKYAQNLIIVRHEGYIVVTLQNPWKEGKVLHHERMRRPKAFRARM